MALVKKDGLEVHSIGAAKAWITEIRYLPRECKRYIWRVAYRRIKEPGVYKNLKQLYDLISEGRDPDE